MIGETVERKEREKEGYWRVKKRKQVIGEKTARMKVTEKTCKRK